MMTQSATLVRWTIRDYHTLIDAGLFLDRQVELLNGLVVEQPTDHVSDTACPVRDQGNFFFDRTSV